MAEPEPDRFQKALQKFKKCLSPDLVQQFSISSLRDVQTVFIQIQEQHGREGCLRRMKRIQGFIEAMNQLGTVLDVFVNANELICFVWGPLKFLLLVAKNHLDAIDKLLDAYSQVGAAIPGLVVYQSTFEKYPPLAGILEDYYSDILQFHEAALEVFKRPRWKELLKSAWKNFDTNLQPILQSMKQRRELLESEKQSASLFELTKGRETISGLQEEFQQQTLLIKLAYHDSCVSRIREKLQAPDYWHDQDMATKDRGGSTSGAWVLQCQEFLGWNCKTTSVNGILYINGLPGAGKTTLMSAVIERLQNENRASDSHCETLVAYFYFKHGQQGRSTHNDLLKAILEQIIKRDTILSDHLSKILNAVDEVDLRSTKTLESHIQSCLGDYRTCFILIDGLDEADFGETAKSVDWLLSLASGERTDIVNTIRVLFCGRRDGILDKLLSKKPSITLEDSPEHIADIRRYCITKCSEIQEAFHLPSDIQDDIISRVATHAKGMFLYARIVLENLLYQTTLSGIKQEIEPKTFPVGLDKA